MLKSKYNTVKNQMSMQNINHIFCKSVFFFFGSIFKDCHVISTVKV